MSKQSISQGSLLELKAITAEHADRLAKEGRSAVRGARSVETIKGKDRDPFARPSPGLVKRLAREARNDAKLRAFDREEVGEEQRRAILEAKAKRYDALKRGDLSGFSERELAEANIDYDNVGAWSDHSSDVDESATVSREVRDGGFDTLGDMEEVEYVDELGRTRRGTMREAREAERAKEKMPIRVPEEEEPTPQSHLIYGDQAYFPVYQPDPEELKAKWLESERAARQHHYDSTKEVRTRGAGAYQFSLDDEKRAEQMASLDAQRLDTEAARAKASNARAAGVSVAQDAKRRRLDERRRVVENKREQLIGKEKLQRLREEKRARETEDFFAQLDEEVRKSPNK